MCVHKSRYLSIIEQLEKFESNDRFSMYTLNKELQKKKRNKEQLSKNLGVCIINMKFTNNSYERHLPWNSLQQVTIALRFRHIEWCTERVESVSVAPILNCSGGPLFYTIIL